MTTEIPDYVEEAGKIIEINDKFKSILGVDKILKQNQQSFESIKTEIKTLSEKVDGNSTEIKKHNTESSKKDSVTENPTTKGRSVWFAFIAIGTILAAVALSSDPERVLDNTIFQAIMTAIVGFAIGRQTFKIKSDLSEKKSSKL